MDDASRLDEYSRMVDAELNRVVSDRHLPLYSMMEHHLGWSIDDGLPAPPQTRKLGALCLASCESLDGDPNVALPAAAAIELVHGFCEIHDDIQSGKVGRNDRDSVWWKWGPAQAINAGDGMHALARLSLFGLSERGFAPDTVFEAVKLLDQASLATCEGRFMDLEAQERLDMTSEAYLRMASAKSGSLYGCAMELGALASSRPDQARAAFSAAGRALGIAVQISEDLRQVEPDGQHAGTIADDLLNKKKLYPVVKAFELANPSERRRLGDYYFKRVIEPSDAEGLTALIVDLGATEMARAEIDALVQSSLESVRNSGHVAGDAARLCDMILALVGRT